MLQLKNTNENHDAYYSNEDIVELFRKKYEKDKLDQELKNKENRIKKRKINQFEELLKTKLFQKYLKTSYQIIHILYYIFTLFINNFSWVCYFLMILDHIHSSSIITTFYPLSIFCYAILEYPRPKKKYWICMLLYTMIIICCKFIIQMQIIKIISIYTESSKDYTDDYSDFIKIYISNNRIGLKYFPETFSSEFISYILFDAFVVLSILINRNLLIADGLWDFREDEIENIYEASERIAINKDKKIHYKYESMELLLRYFHTNDEIKQLKIIWNLPGIDTKQEKKFKKESKDYEEYDEAHKNYFDKIFPVIRNEKPGGEFYPLYALLMFLICIYILLFYTQMDQDKIYGAVNLDTTQFSGAMVIFLIAHIIILTYDRVIFVSQNREDINYDYVYYKKSERTKFEGKLLKEGDGDLKQIHKEIKKDIEGND